MSDYRLNRNELLRLANENKDSYRNAKPFPHIVLDNVFPETVLENILSEFPKSGDVDWQQFKSPYELKLASRREDQFGDYTCSFLHLLNSQTFLDFLEALTGIDCLISDPAFEGGGLHQILPGGFLKIHADFNKHSKNKLDRRLNVLIYLNKDWQESYGGHFELWDQKMKQAEKRILPVFNRLAIFSTTDFSFHGHPDPLRCPEGRTRKSIATYYYTNGRPAEEITPNLESHNTLFKERPQEVGLSLRRKAKETLKIWLPPKVTKVLSRMRKGFRDDGTI